MRNRYKPEKKSPDLLTILLWAGFILAAIITALIAIKTGRDVANVQQTNQPGIATPTSYAIPDLSSLGLPDENDPLQISTNRPGSRVWDKNEPLVVLLLGNDTRKYEGAEGAGLTDTIILATIDLQKNTAGLMSIPRDLWLEHSVSQYSPSKVNQLFMIGEGTGYPGGGPALLMDTLADFFGVEINHYAMVDFNAFITLVDTAGGVKIDVPRRININPIGPGTVTLKKGVQTLTGDLALAYVRARHTSNGDFDRAERQQQVLLALQRQLIRFDVLPLLIKDFPSLYRDLADGVETNLTLSQLITLGRAIMQIPSENISQKIIAPPLVTPTFSYQGYYILAPDQPAILAEWKKIYSPSAENIAPQATLGASLQQLVADENASVAVRNGTGTPGLAGDTAEFLRGKGFNVEQVGNAEQSNSETIIYDYSGKTYSIRYLLTLMDLPESRLYHRYSPDAEYDIIIILGDDWAVDNPIP